MGMRVRVLMSMVFAADAKVEALLKVRRRNSLNIVTFAIAVIVDAVGNAIEIDINEAAFVAMGVRVSVNSQVVVFGPPWLI